MNDNERGFMAQEQTITLSRRVIPGLLSLLLLLVFIGFMIGYFLGVKYTTDEFVTQIRQETLADQLLVSSAGNTGGANGSEQETITAATASEAESAPCEVSDFAPCSAQGYAGHGKASSFAKATADLTSDMTAGEQPKQVVVQLVPTTASAEVTAARYSAELIGFGTKAAAQEFIKRVSAYNPVALELKERHSKTARGKVIKWYQVVTGKYEQKHELQKQLDTLIKKERLQDIKIVAFAPNPKDKDIA